MLLFLLTYMIFYYSLFDRMGELYEQSGYYNTVSSQLNIFAGKQLLLEDKTEFNSFIEDKQRIVER